MEPSRRASLVLLIAAGLIAVASGAWVALSRGSGSPLRSGTAAPAFELPRLAGGVEALDRYRGRVVFVNFWATWCAPCREEAPALQRLREALRGVGFEVLAVSIDEPGAKEKVESFVREFGLGFPVLLDPEKRVHDAYQVYGVPETFLIDKGGRVVERFIGPRNWDDARYQQAVQRLIELEPAALPAGEVRGG